MTLTVNGTKNTYNQYIGGIVGYNYGSAYGGELSNCYNAAPMNITSNISAKNKYFGGCAGIEMAEANGFKNNYYDKNECSMTAVVGRYKNGDAYSDNENPAGSAGLDTWAMKTQDFPATLGNAYSYDYNNLNKGYPVLSVMTYHEESNWSEWFDDEVEGAGIDVEVYNRLYPAELMNKDLKQPVTRVEFAAVAVKLYEEMGGTQLVAADLQTPFTDTSSDVVAKAYNIGIVNGVTDTQFDPYSKISRQDLATMLTRVYKSLYLSGWNIKQDEHYVLDYTVSRVFDDDADISDYAKPSVYFMVDNNVIKGLSENTFGPRNVSSRQEAENYANATREQALIMAVRSFKNLLK